MLDRKELKKRIFNFLDKYGEGYATLDLEEAYFLEMSIDNYIANYYEDAYYKPINRDNVFFQIFSAIGAFEQEVNPYFQLATLIEKEYGLNYNIIEVGSGLFPALALEIAKKQKKLEKGTITVYEPNLVPKILEGITLINKDFPLVTELPQNSLIIGRKPCKTTENMIRIANQTNSEFFIQLCKCAHAPIEYKLKSKSDSNNTWIKYLMDVAQDTLPLNFSVEETSIIDPLFKTEETIIKTKRIG
jgi:hypothetical protein